MRVAILGTGKMGTWIARRLSRSGHELTLWNRTRRRAEATGAGAVAATPSEAVNDAEVVISILTDADAVRSVYLGADGAVAAANGQVFVEMSTAGPDVNIEVSAAIQHRGADFVEAPVLGSEGAILAGTAVVLAAGSQEAINRARPVLESLGEVRYVGQLGSGAALKLIANTMLSGVYALAAELLAAGVTAGLSIDEVFFVLNRIAPLLTQRKAGFVEHRYEPVTFAMHDAVKDLELAKQLFTRLGAATPMSDEARELFKKAAASLPDAEMSAIASLYDKHAAGRKA